jgi:hypothetical protein
VPGRLGAYRIDDLSRVSDATFVETRGSSGFFVRAGFAHLPSGPEALPDDARLGATFEPLGDDWYRWVIHD